MLGHCAISECPISAVPEVAVVPEPAPTGDATARDYAGQVDHRHGHYERVPSRDTRITPAMWRALEDRLRAEDAPPIKAAPPRPRAPRLDASRADRARAIAALAGVAADPFEPVTLGSAAPRYQYGSAEYLDAMDEEAAIAVLLGMV